jgi:uncharacterized protein with HEPN domain
LIHGYSSLAGATVVRLAGENIPQLIDALNQVLGAETE